jgi:hypothetical protein
MTHYTAIRRCLGKFFCLNVDARLIWLFKRRLAEHLVEPSTELTYTHLLTFPLLVYLTDTRLRWTRPMNERL